MAGARRLGPDELPWLWGRVAELAHQAELPPPTIYLIDSSTPNAFATGRAPTHSSVAVTTALTHLLTHDELAGVLAHELSHIRQGHTTIATMTALLAGGLAVVFCPKCWPALPARAQQGTTTRRTGWLHAILLALITPFAALIVQLGSARGREYQADAQGAALLGDPLLLASALEKTEWAAREVPMRSNPGLSLLYFVSPLPQQAGMLRFFNTHPTTASRVALLRKLARQGWPDTSVLPIQHSHARHDAP
jgi:heat shock protein HtpX